MKKIDLGVIVTTLIIVTISCSLAFFAARVIGNPKDINLVAKNVAITFTDTSSIASDVISPGWNNVKTFTITNNSKEDFSYNITLKGLVNTFESINTLQYKITSDNGYDMDNYLNVIKTETSKDVVLAYNITIPKNTIQSYQVEFNYVSTEEDQSGDMGKKLGGTLAIEASTGTPEIYDKLLADNPTIKTRTDFSTTLTETNVNTLYKAQEDNTDVYYFAGDAKNNWVKFGGYYWRIIRTNSDGSIRLLYAGTSPDVEDAYINNECFTEDCVANGSKDYISYKNSGVKKTLESWYDTNLINYDKYISKSANYCSDETEYDTINGRLYFQAANRLYLNKAPTYDCDSSNTLTGLKVGLMNPDEAAFAGGVFEVTGKTYYYYNSKNSSAVGQNYWWLAGGWGYTGTAYIFNIEGRDGSLTGAIEEHSTYSTAATRPVINLKGDLIYKSGDGSAEYPYEIEETLYQRLLTDKSTVITEPRGGSYNKIFADENTKTLYTSTESIASNEEKTVYYFAGNATDNWVKFGGYYWRIIRTNNDNSIRLLYHGTSSDTTEAYIDTTTFNSANNDIMYVGYMYGTSGSLENNRTNKNSSTIKNIVDTWYQNNLLDYTKYLSTTAVYCNDRGYLYETSINFPAYSRLNTNKTPSYNCTNSKDAFSASNSEAKLRYPIALMTADEMSFAGGVIFTNAPTVWYYSNSLNTSSTGSNLWWTMTPYTWDGSYSREFVVDGSTYPGDFGFGHVGNSFVIRPVISLNSSVVYKSGDGTADSPYEIVLN